MELNIKKYLLTGLVSVILFSCNDKDPDKDPFVQPVGERYGEIFTGGQYHLGPVDWEESEWTNANGPYPLLIQQIEGNYLAGLENTHNGNGQLCDACVKIETDKGKSIIARVITTGITTMNSIDVSPEVYEILNSGEYPRWMSWYVTKCPPNGENIYYQFKEESSQWWVGMWVRNIGLPLVSVEVKSQKYANWLKLTRENDGSYVAKFGFGTGAFTLRITAIDGQIIEDTYESFDGGDLLRSSGQFE